MSDIKWDSRSVRTENAPTAKASGPAPERDLGQRRARAAWRWVEEGLPLGEKYGILTQKLSSYLQVSGLGQTFAFLYGRGYDRGFPMNGSAHGLLLKQLGEYLKEYTKRSRPDPMENLLSLTPAEYRAVTQELMAVAEWLKRFAEGRLGGDTEEEL